MTDKTQHNMNVLMRPTFALPDNLSPAGLRCVQLWIPDDDQHMACFVGAVRLLTYWNSWERDASNGGKIAARAWMDAINQHPLFEKCGSDANSGYAGAGGGDDDPMIRQNPDNPCELQNSVDGVTWCTWADISLCVPGGSQPGGDSHQPPPGGEACYHAAMNGNSQWLLPTNVSTGDVLTISKMGGAVGDAPFGNWTCPPGTAFVLGACVPGTGGHAGGDPSATAFHGAIICKIGAVWYDITAAPVTVPSGISSVPVYFQVNDSDITNNQGQYTFEVCVENNEPADWSSTLDFRTDSYAAIMASVDNGTWVIGSGYEGTATGDPNSLHVAQVNVLIDGSRVTSLSIRYTAGGGSGPNANVRTRYNGYLAYGSPGSVGVGANLLYGEFNDISGVTNLIPGINSGTDTDQVILHSLTITGKGVKPSQLP